MRLLALALFTLAALLWANPALGQPADPVARAKALVEQKEPNAAFELLAPLEGARAGEVEFDYWLGVAALDSDRLERAAMAFERVLVRNPDFDSARLELARTYLRMGALDLAAQEFTRLLGRAPNETGRKLLQDYLEQITRIKERQRFAVSAYVELGAGHDTNLSNSTRDFASAIENSFGISGIEPTGNSIRRADDFLAGSAGVDAAYRLQEDRTLFASADLFWRSYREFNDYNYLLADISGACQARVGEFTYTATAFLQAFRQDGAFVDTLGSDRVTNDRDSYGLYLEVRRDLDSATQLAFASQIAGYRYRTSPGQDTNQLQMFASLDHRPQWWPGTTLSARFAYGYDDALRPLNPFTQTTASRHTVGARIVAQSDARVAFAWQSALGWSRRIDDDPFSRATLVTTGRDDLMELYLRGIWKFAGSWSLQPYALYVYNRSNIEIHTFRKAEGGVMLRHDFR